MVKLEPEVVEKLKCGDKKAYESLFMTHYKNLVLYAKKFVVDTEIARDIVQDVFFYLWEKRNTLNIDKSISSYLFRSVRNACINHLKRDSLKEDYIKQFLLTINGQELSTDKSLDVHELVVHKDLLQRIELIIESLPDQCKNMFRMSRFRGLKNKEIAEIYSVSTRTVETQIYRALKVLKEDLSLYLTSAASFLLCFQNVILEL
jgi:RNA polymerase sigma-70 factor (ECF subfamily)